MTSSVRFSGTFDVEGAGQMQRLEFLDPGIGYVVVGPGAGNGNRDFVVPAAFEGPVIGVGDVARSHRRGALRAGCRIREYPLIRSLSASCRLPVKPMASPARQLSHPYPCAEHARPKRRLILCPRCGPAPKAVPKSTNKFSLLMRSLVNSPFLGTSAREDVERFIAPGRGGQIDLSDSGQRFSALSGPCLKTADYFFCRQAGKQASFFALGRPAFEFGDARGELFVFGACLERHFRGRPRTPPAGRDPSSSACARPETGRPFPSPCERPGRRPAASVMSLANSSRMRFGPVDIVRSLIVSFEVRAVGRECKTAGCRSGLTHVVSNRNISRAVRPARQKGTQPCPKCCFFRSRPSPFPISTRSRCRSARWPYAGMAWHGSAASSLRGGTPSVW